MICCTAIEISSRLFSTWDYATSSPAGNELTEADFSFLILEHLSGCTIVHTC